MCYTYISFLLASVCSLRNISLLMGGGVRLVVSMGAVIALFGWLTVREAAGTRLYCARGGRGREREGGGIEGTDEGWEGREGGWEAVGKGREGGLKLG